MEALIIILLFIFFLVLLKRIVKLLINAVYIIIASAIFPIFAVKFLGLSIPLTLETFFFFIKLGLLLFFVYLLYSFIYAILNALETFASKITLKEYRKEKILKEIIEKHKKEKKSKPQTSNL